MDLQVGPQKPVRTPDPWGAGEQTQPREGRSRAQGHLGVSASSLPHQAQHPPPVHSQGYEKGGRGACRGTGPNFLRIRALTRGRGEV